MYVCWEKNREIRPACCTEQTLQDFSFARTWRRRCGKFSVRLAPMPPIRELEGLLIRSGETPTSWSHMYSWKHTGKSTPVSSFSLALWGERKDAAAIMMGKDASWREQEIPREQKNTKQCEQKMVRCIQISKVLLTTTLAFYSHYNIAVVQISCPLKWLPVCAIMLLNLLPLAHINVAKAS